jgi:membrane protease YdiL (CAAX protease family)
MLRPYITLIFPAHNRKFMDLFTVLTLAGIIAFIGVTIYIANTEQAQGKSPIGTRFLLYTVMAMMFLLAPSAYFMTQSPDYTGTSLEMWLAIGLVAAGVGVSYLTVTSERFRRVIELLIGEAGSFNAASTVHSTAIVLMIALFLWNTIPFVMQGGVEGYARALEESGGVSTGEPIISAVLQIAAAFLGIGLYIRRLPSGSLERLGLRIPIQQDITVGVGVGVMLLGLAWVFSIIWLIAAPETINQQSSAPDQIARSFSSVPLAFLLAICAAFGEEIFMRGALQPVFGIFGSSIFFVSLHAQYLITPPLLLIFVVSLVLGVLRKRVSTNAAILAHFIYNFIPLALLASGSFQ